MNPSTFLGQVRLDTEVFALIIPALIFMIPIIAILTAHQRKMAAIIHGGNATDPNAVHPMVVQELQNLRAEVGQLRDTVNRQTLEHDNLRRQLGSVTEETRTMAPVSSQVQP